LSESNQKNPASQSLKKGYFYATLAFISWGILPIYWKLLKSVSAPEILCHRIIWSLVFISVVLLLWRRLDLLKSIFIGWKKHPLLFLASLLIGSNWLTYIYAVNSDRVLETSLGYYLNPMISVFLGIIFFKEKHSFKEKIAIFLAGSGVLYMIVIYGRLPWIALVLAVTFGLYGLLKKISPLHPMESLGIETLYLTPLALIYLGYLNSHEEMKFFQSESHIVLGLIFAGAITALPLIWFSSAAQNLSLSTLGFFQYLSPSCTFLLAVFFYGEPFTFHHMITFSLIWSALALYSMEMIKRGNEKKP
jgi:chloramphenicol-sensitive protein RarD